MFYLKNVKEHYTFGVETLYKVYESSIVNSLSELQTNIVMGMSKRDASLPSQRTSSQNLINGR